MKRPKKVPQYKYTITERDIIELLTALSNDDIDFVVDFFEDLIPNNDDDNTYSLEQILANAGVIINRNYLD